MRIVYIHTDWIDHLEIILRQASASNPSSEVCFISRTPERAPEGILQFQLDDFFHAARCFEPLYFHESDQGFEYERFCIQRWFVLFEFMMKTNTGVTFAADTDVMLYSDLAKVLPHYNDCDITLSAGHGCHSVFIIRPEILGAFCEYITNVFSDENRAVLKEIKSDWRLMQGNLNHRMTVLNDMRLFKAFAEFIEFRVGDTRLVIDDACFDHNLNASEGFEMEDNRKKIFWKDGIPYAIHRRLQRPIRFHSLHFQGGLKDLIIPWSRMPIERVTSHETA